MKSFMNFVREQGVVGLAVGIILGTAVTQLVTSLVQDIVNPFLGILPVSYTHLTLPTILRV